MSPSGRRRRGSAPRFETERPLPSAPWGALPPSPEGKESDGARQTGRAFDSCLGHKTAVRSPLPRSGGGASTGRQAGAQRRGLWEPAEDDEACREMTGPLCGQASAWPRLPHLTARETKKVLRLSHVRRERRTYWTTNARIFEPSGHELGSICPKSGGLSFGGKGFRLPSL